MINKQQLIKTFQDIWLKEKNASTIIFKVRFRIETSLYK